MHSTDSTEFATLLFDRFQAALAIRTSFFTPSRSLIPVCRRMTGMLLYPVTEYNLRKAFLVVKLIYAIIRWAVPPDSSPEDAYEREKRLSSSR